MFSNILTPKDKYLFRDCENLLSPIQKQGSLKPKTFSCCFVPFLDPTSNFEHFEKKKMIVIAALLRKLHTAKELVRPLFKEHRFSNLFECQHLKGSQTILKSASEDFYKIFSSL